jgi:hypothetical protein
MTGTTRDAKKAKRLFIVQAHRETLQARFRFARS